MSTKTYEGLSAGIFLVGLGLLFLTGIGIWPWILVVIGLASLPASLAMKKGWYGWQGTLWLVGLAVLFWSGHFWPGILILVGLSALGGAVTREQDGSPFSGQATQAPGAAAPAPTQPLPTQGPAQTARLDDKPTDEGKQG